MANNEHINKVVKSTGETLIDLTNDTVTAGTLLKDVTAHDRSGAEITGAVIVAPTDVTETSDTTPYIYKSSEHDAIYDELVGGSVAWNQLVANSGTSLSVTITSGHKYILKKSGTLSVGASSGSAITGLTGGTDWITDLTQMFGSTIADYVYNLEQSTAGSGIAWLKSYGFFTKDYYAYNAGGLVSVNTSGKKVVGKNLVEKTIAQTNVVANGTIQVPVDDRYDVHICKVKRGYHYFLTTGTNGPGAFVYAFYSENPSRGSVSYDNTRYVTSPAAITSPIDGYMAFRTSAEYTTPQCELGSRATDYEPYTSITYPIQSTDLRGLYKLNGNKLYTDGDIYSADGTVTRKYGYRGYQSGDESLANAITDGTRTIYKLSAPTTETASSYTSPQMVYRNGTEEYLDTRDVPIPVGGNRKYVDIPDWMINEYFDGIRADSSIIDEIKKEADTLEEHLKAFIIESNIGDPTRINNTSDFTVELFDKIWGTNTDLYPRFAHLYLFGNEAHFLKAIIESVMIYTPTTHTSEKLIQATFISEMSMYYFRWVRGQAPSINKYTISVT